MVHNENRKDGKYETKKCITLHRGGGSRLSRPTDELTATESQKASVWMALSAFTMAEILLSLTIIGVVAAITLPSLTGNMNERTWNTQRKALYARFSQAIALMPALNGYGTLIEGDSSTSAVDTAAETFVTDGLSKVLKINNICDNDHLADCGIAISFTNLAASNYSWPVKLSALNSTFSNIDTKAAAFETQNGESIAVYYNPKCVADMGETWHHQSQAKMCANFIYDLNGNKGPNTVGKDIGFITALYPTDSVVVAPMSLSRNTSSMSPPQGASKLCTQQDPESRLPNRDELTAMFYNRELIGNITSGFLSSSTINLNTYWGVNVDDGSRYPADAVYWHSIRCVKR